MLGMRESWQPTGHFEEMLTHQAALNRWKQARLERWSTDIIRGQIEHASSPTREDLESAIEALPGDERFWNDVDAEAVLRTLELVSAGQNDLPVAPEVAEGAFRAVQVASDSALDVSTVTQDSASTDERVSVDQIATVDRPGSRPCRQVE